MKTVFECRSYIEFLKNYISALPKQGRGTQTLLASAIGCQQTYLSKVLAGKAELSVDQGYEACRYFGLSAAETDYFVTLLLLNRASTPNTKAYLEKKLNQILRSHHNLRERFNKSINLDAKAMATYYSDWSYAAIHVLTSIPGFRTPEAIARRLHLSMKHVQEVLEFLIRVNLVTKKDVQFTMSKKSIHLGSDNPLISNHHRNWRLRALNELKSSADNLHYSSVITCSKADMNKIKEVLIKAIEEVRKLVEGSGEETICSYGIDFFELI